MIIGWFILADKASMAMQKLGIACRSGMSTL